METALRQRQSQKMSLAPQMREGLKLLALNLPELRQELFAEMARNPVIEGVESTLEASTVSEKERESEAADAVSDYPADDYDAAEAYDTTRADADAVERRQRFFDSQVREETLAQHLLAQLAASDIADEDRPLAEILIGELDDDGRFVGSVPDIAMVAGETESKVRAVLARIREFDPPGCGAATLRECLEAQLDAIADPALRARVAALLGDLEGVAAGRVGDAAAVKALRSLDPRPGRAYRRDTRGPEYVNPEVHAVRCGDGWVARVDARSLPEIRISAKYVTMLEDPSVAADVKAYIRERIAAARNVVEAVARRRETIERIAQEIFDRQPGFFTGGLKALKPLTMQAVADAAGVHVATVSRTVNGKYASTPRGTVELRRFFVQGVATATGETVAREGVLDRLRAIVAAEDAAKPLSDGRLAARLAQEGFSVARRTVAKYRGLAGIPDVAARQKERKGKQR